jgi:hypothetical protein
MGWDSACRTLKSLSDAANQPIAENGHCTCGKIKGDTGICQYPFRTGICQQRFYIDGEKSYGRKLYKPKNRA